MHVRRALVLLLVTFVTLLAACSDGASDDGGNAAFGRDVSVAEAHRLVVGSGGDESGAVVIDVRTPNEFASGHIAGAMNVDVSAPSFDVEIGKLDRDRQYVVYCHSGNRSNVAVTKMEALGFRDVHNVLGGVGAWEAQGFDLVR